MLQTKVVETFKRHILCLITFFLKSCRLWDNVGKYCTGWRITDDAILRSRNDARMQTHAHNMQYFLQFNGYSGYTNAPKCYILRTLPVLPSTPRSSKWSLLARFPQLYAPFLSPHTVLECPTDRPRDVESYLQFFSCCCQMWSRSSFNERTAG